jgi:glycosyltransferase involved in cell wall biosynthesis
MQLGLRPRDHFPATHKQYSLVRTHGRVFAVPPPLDAEDLLKSSTLFTHPAVLSAPTLGELQALIDQAGDTRPELVLRHKEYDLLRHRGELLAVLRSARPVDLDLPDERRRGGVLRGDSIDDLRRRIDEARAATPVEFAGWLPIFELSSNCGRHPQFTHVSRPPEGYRFSCSAPPPRRPWRFWKKSVAPLLEKTGKALGAALSAVRPFFSMLCGGPRVGLRTRLRVLGAMGRLGVRLLRAGAGPLAVARFLQSRHFHSQLLLGRCDDLVFLTSFPYTYGQNPWVVEIEDPTTLFFPMAHNGRTGDRDLGATAAFPVLKAMLEADHCKGIITHMKSTARLVPALFKSETIRKKVFYAPLGVQVPPRWRRHDEERDPDEIHLLFINSWHQIPTNFYLRGGLDVLEAFATLKTRYPQLRLTLRSHLPALDDHFHRILESNWVRVINRMVTPEEMAELHLNSDIYLLPAARVHIVSLLQAMSYGLPVVASDGWGFEEYVEHERNALVVKGRYGKVTWADYDAGVLREDYDPMYTADPDVVAGIVESVSRLVEDRKLRARLGRAARADVETKYSLARWNAALKTAFDRALGKDVGQASRPAWAGLPPWPTAENETAPASALLCPVEGNEPRTK